MMYLFYRNTHDVDGNYREEYAVRESLKESLLSNKDARFIHLLDPKHICIERNIYCNFDNLVARILVWNEKVTTEDAKITTDIAVIMQLLGNMIDLGVVTVGEMA